MKPDPILPTPSSGDDGTTNLPGGLRVRKSDGLVRAGGSLDELNAALGLLKVLREGQTDSNVLESVQRTLLDIGSELATGKPRLTGDVLSLLDDEIQRLNAALPPLHDFILPGGNEASARAQFARTVCRRAESDLVDVRDRHPERVSLLAMATLNRLSAYLFALARTLNASP
jgi:cob(I)alamin adenosyltransferase